MLILYGLKNCDSCRKAMRWLADAGADARLHDFRKDGLEAAKLAGWIAAVGWESLLNRRGTTWRGLSEDEKAGLDEAAAQKLMLAHPALIKRPVIALGETVLVGFGDDTRAALEKIGEH